jgi:outer membrane lipoprotein LolB
VIARVAAATALSSLLAGCATWPPAPASEEDWPARREALQALDAWTLDGRIAVAAGDDGFSGGLRWAQAPDRADIAVTGPLGGQGLSIRVEGGEATVVLDGEPIAAAESERLLARYFGAERPLPVAEMRYWVTGVPAPGTPAEETLGDDRRLARLAQSGWQVSYERYRSVGALSLPARIEMKTEGLRLRLVASDWQLMP